ncbi:MAG: penicillin-binding protein 2 [Candidatus Omnitrophica bacterium]|nr:penicillin-binding protein 2 [Candidatus Omnitrophota bacterium]
MRLKSLSFIVLISFTVLIISLANIQLNKYDFYKQLSDKNRIRLVPLPAARGSIYDRYGRILAEDKPLFVLSLAPDEFFRQDSATIEQILKRLSEISGVPAAQIRERLNKRKTPSFVPVVILSNLDKDKALAIEEKSLGIGGLVVQVIPRRSYPYKDIAAHVIGYIGKVGPKEVGQRKRYGYHPPGWVGRAGVEKSADAYLMGEDGGRQIEVNHLGRQVRKLGIKLPRRGKDIYLTLDIELQKVAYRLLTREGLRGVIIVMEPHTGEILTMVSCPSFDPNDFVEGDRKRIRRILHSRSSPLLNRAIAGLYPPGSTFKPLVAIAGLETKKISPDSYLYCSGRHQIGNRFFYCWKRSGHHWLNVKGGLAYSCNVFFYKLGEKLGVDNLSKFALLFGLGKKTGINLPGEKRGLVPTRSWKYLTRRERWYQGETALFSIGQGYILVTPLQMARAVSVIANGGYLVRPRIIKRVTGSGKREAGEGNPYPVPRKLDISLKNINIVRDGMVKAVEDKNGTAHGLKIDNLNIAAKTGTAQVEGKEANSWIVGFCPVRDPEIVFVILIEEGGTSTRRVSIAKELIEKWREINCRLQASN